MEWDYPLLPLALLAKELESLITYNYINVIYTIMRNDQNI
ncbi:hypothetical protein ULO1_27400, partial [Carboxydocella sp. ULO1]